MSGILYRQSSDKGFTYCGHVDADEQRYNKAVVRLKEDKKWIDTNNSTHDFQPNAVPTYLKNNKIRYNMNTIRQFLLLFFMLVPTLLPSQNRVIEQDKTIRKGKLPNGLTYYIHHNDKTKGVADFYIAQHVGSIRGIEPARARSFPRTHGV